jgi:hypothetical protein
MFLDERRHRVGGGPLVLSAQSFNKVSAKFERAAKISLAMHAQTGTQTLERKST